MWSHFITDILTSRRHMNIGNPTRALALVDPERDTYLPVDDRAWEQGVRKSCLQSYLDTNIRSRKQSQVSHSTSLQQPISPLRHSRASVSHRTYSAWSSHSLMTDSAPPISGSKKPGNYPARFKRCAHSSRARPRRKQPRSVSLWQYASGTHPSRAAIISN